MNRIWGFVGIVACLCVAAVSYRLFARYRVAIEHSGVGRPYPIGNSALAFLGLAACGFAIIAAGVLVMVTFL